MEWIDPAVNFGKYERVLIERIRVNLDSDSAAVDPADLKALTDYFHQTLVKTLQPRFPVVETPGPNVLRVRVTLVDLVATKPEVSVIVLVTPYATVPDLALSAASGGPTGSAPYLGRTGVAVQFIDGESNAVVAEYAEEDFGRKFVLDEKGDVGATLSKTADGYTKAFSTWAYAKQAMDRWALMFRTRLEAAGKPRPA